MWRNWTLLLCQWECEMVQPLWKMEWRFLRVIIKVYLSYNELVSMINQYIFSIHVYSVHLGFL